MGLGAIVPWVGWSDDPQSKWASRLYSREFSVTVDRKGLERLERRDFATHSNACAEALHRVGEWLLTPTYWFIQSVARANNPLPGANKECTWRGRQITNRAKVSAALTAVPTMVSLPLGLSVRAMAHGWRPLVSVLNAAPPDYRPPKIYLDAERPLHIRSANLCLVPRSVAIAIDVRDPVERARELGQAMLDDPHPPSIIFVQEAWNEDAVKALWAIAKKRYYFGICHVAPQIVGMNASVMVLSQHPIEELVFERYKNMVTTHSPPPRGILRVTLATEKGSLLVYNSHTQSMRGGAFSKARLLQLQQLQAMVQRDAEANAGVWQLIVGDLNSPDFLENGKPSSPDETPVLSYLHSHFDDLFLKDHDRSGIRTAGHPRFLAADNQKMGQYNFDEPRASWYDGPMGNCPEAFWGREGWFSKQHATRTRYDYIATPKNQQVAGRRLTGHVEMRRYVVKSTAQSAPSDHLPVDALIWVEAVNTPSQKGTREGNAALSATEWAAFAAHVETERSAERKAPLTTGQGMAQPLKA
jgi:endonuclease/exonuclease/phosphatase family metal-dependent hydrolase